MENSDPNQLINSIAETQNHEEMALKFRNTLANDLNSNSDHFLLELLQNADDTEYDEGIRETFSLTYTTSQNLYLRCNEKGFTDDDVRGICGVGESTKRDNANTTGEKGIGFKSVFRVATVVWIASRKHQFKLYDNSFKPEVFQLPFPDGNSIDGKGTHMYFEISEQKKQDVYEAVRSFHPSSMVFLKQMKHIDITIRDEEARKLVRIESPEIDGVSDITIIEGGESVLHYKQFSFPVKLNIERSAYRKQKGSHIKIAIPVTKDFQRVINREEKVYACLPVKSFGFKFAFHADFLLAASREEIHADRLWNQKLRDAMIDKFVEAMEQVNKSESELCYTWPLLLTPPTNPGYFFWDTMKKIQEKIKTRPVLRTEAGDPFIPESYPSVVSVPKKWQLGSGQDSVPDPSKRYKYLSHKYDAECTMLIRDIGVAEIGNYAFFCDLKEFITAGGSDFPHKGNNWHIRLADILNNDWYLHYWSKDLYIIPVEGGERGWACSTSDNENLVIATDYDGVLPQGIGLLSIPEAALENENRRKLYESYGAEAVSKKIGYIVNRIREVHSTFDLNVSELTIEDLVSHVLFLFSNRKETKPPSKLWVATDLGPPQLASETFPKPLEFGGHSLQVPILNKRYLAGLSQQDAQEILTWMCETFQMPQFPRLATSSGAVMSLSPEMNFIAENCDSFHVLDLLRHHWRFASPLLIKGGTEFQQALWNDIVSIRVRCWDPEERLRGETHPLGETVLPSEETDKLTLKVPLPLLPLPKDNLVDWIFLAHLGVKLRPDVEDWLRCLNNIKESSIEVNSSKEMIEKKRHDIETLVSYVYSKIWEACQVDLDQGKLQKHVKETFQSKGLIFIPAISPYSRNPKHAWARPDQCIWQGSRDLALRHSFSLYSYVSYYGHRDFFTKTIEVDPSWDLERLRREASQLVASTDLDTPETLAYVAQLFLEMNRLVAPFGSLSDSDVKTLVALKKCAMLPIRLPNSTKNIDKLVAADGEEEWFVADRQIFQDSFGTEVPLLSLNIRQTEDCDRLLSFLGLRNRQLSEIAVASHTTKTTEMSEYATKWMERAKYIDRLAQRGTSWQGPRLIPLRRAGIKVFASHIVSVRWEAQGRNKKYYGMVKNRIAVAAIYDNTLSIYMPSDKLSSGRTLMELADDICDIYHIYSERRLLVQYVIGQEDIEEVESILESRGIPHLRDQDIGAFGMDFFAAEDLAANTVRQKVTVSSPKIITNKSKMLGNIDANRSSNESTAILLAAQATAKSKTGQSQTDVPTLPNSQTKTVQTRPDTNKTGPDESVEKVHGPKLPINLLKREQQQKPNESEGPALPTSTKRSPSSPNNGDIPRASEDSKLTQKSVAVNVKNQGSSDSRKPQPVSPIAKLLPQEHKKVPENRTGNLSESTFNQAVDLQQRLEKLKKLPVGRRLHDSSIEELLLQGPVYVSQVAQQISNPTILPQTSPSTAQTAGETAAKEWRDPSEARDDQQTASTENISEKISVPESKQSQARAVVETQKLTHMMEAEKSANRTRILVQQFSGNLEASMLFRQSAPTNIFFVTSPKEFPGIHPGAREDSGTRVVLESRLRIPTDDEMERAVYALLPEPMDPNKMDNEFLGQVWVSQLLSNNLGVAYNPENHWKSPWRSRLYPSVQVSPESDQQMPFELCDTSARVAMTRFLMKMLLTKTNSMIPKVWQQQPPIYHINVATTAGTCDSPILMEKSQFIKARQYRIPSGEKLPKHVFIFVRIFNINCTYRDHPPTAAFYLDPWTMYTDGKIDVSPENDKYSVCFTGEPTFDARHIEPRTFEWTPLQGPTTIRLLRLEQGDVLDRLEGSFENCDLNSRELPKYTAISYAWGSSLKQLTLHIRSSPDDRPILLPVSLYSALRRLRDKDTAVWLWADAVCIDQHSNSEKEKQILLLSRIFQSADRVFAWLGDEGGESSEAMKLLTKLGASVMDIRSRAREKDDDPWAYNVRSPDFLPGAGDRQWVAVGNLLKRQWFSRIWIVQEAILARKLVVACGAETIIWEVMHAATSLCFMKALWGQTTKCPIADERTQKNILQLGNLRAQAREKEHYHAPDGMFNLLQSFHQKDVTLPRDRLFALLSMCNDGSEARLRPRYEGSDADIISSYVSLFVDQGYGLDLLYQARMAWKRDGLPSWMPNLTAIVYPKTITEWGRKANSLGTGFDAGQASQSSKLGIKNGSVNGTILSLQGYEVDEIESLGKYPSNTDDIVLFIEEVFAYVDAVYHPMPAESLDEIKCRIPIGDTHKPAAQSWDPEPDERSGTEPTRLDAFSNMVMYLNYRRRTPAQTRAEAAAIQEAGRADKVVSDAGLLRRRMWPYFRTAIEFAGNFEPASAVVCRTERGRVGIVPDLAWPGDKIVVFRGAAVPYIIRESDTTPGVYRAVGECYVDGIMHGELFQTQKDEPMHRLQHFQLE